MMKALILLLAACLLTSCAAQPAPNPQAVQGPVKVIAVESILADLAQNVAGDRLTIDTLAPLGLDPHTLEPTPKDITRLASADVVILNGAGLEAWLDDALASFDANQLQINASSGIQPRSKPAAETVESNHPQETDPHFWLDPLLTIHYIENIRDGLAQADPAGKDVYKRNASAYIARLRELDAWAMEQFAQVPPEKRLMVTNHQSFGYFADRYGLEVVGAISPSTGTEASPSAQQIAGLVRLIQESGAPAIFLETGANPQIAEQIASETGVPVITDLYTHSLGPSNSPASTYLEMMRHNITTIVEALNRS